MEMEMMDALEMEASADAVVTGLHTTVEKLAAIAASLELAAGRLLAGREAFALSAEAALEQRLAATEAELVQLRATGAFAPALVTHSSAPGAGRKTLPIPMVHLLAKQGVSIESLEAGALDTALNSLSIEQRIAVKAQLLRAGLIA